MFIANQNNYIPAIFEGEMYFSSLELTSFKPWFLCDVSQFHDDSNEILFTSTYLIGDIKKLTDFACENKIEKSFIASPGYMTETGNWSLTRLKSIAQAMFKSDDIQCEVYRFELLDGKYIDHVVGGLKKPNHLLEFKIILEFN